MAFLLATICISQVNAADDRDILPDITTASLADIGQICQAIRVADFPMRQSDMELLLGLTHMRLLYGTGGKNIRFYNLMALTNKTPTGDFYGIRVYYTRNPVDKEELPLVEEITVCFNSSMGDFLCEKPEMNPESLAQAKAEMKRDGLTPIAFVRRRFPSHK